VEWPVPGQGALGPHAVRVIRARHDTLAVATSFRLTLKHGPSVVFSGDTGWQPELGELTEGADVFICECSNVEAGYWAHLSVEEIERHRAEMRAKTVFLSHLSDAARAVAMQRATALDVTIADDGMSLLL
jgi:ribonuclease BN (tRNA processing enzyme)